MTGTADVKYVVYINYCHRHCTLTPGLFYSSLFTVYYSLYLVSIQLFAAIPIEPLLLLLLQHSISKLITILGQPVHEVTMRTDTGLQ